MEPFIAQIMMFGGNFAPRDWAFCDGQLLAISSNEALFSLIGTTYGGDGRTTFGLPDLRGRAPMQYGTGPGLAPFSWGQRGGAETHKVTVQQLPAHNHLGTGLTASFGVNEEDGDSEEPKGRNIGIAASGTPYNSHPNDATLGAGSSPVAIGGDTGNNGGGQSFNMRNPYLVVNYIIALQGIYPSRN